MIETATDKPAGQSIFGIVAGPVYVVCMSLTALWLLHRELNEYHLHDFLHELARIPPTKLTLAAGLTILNYLILVAYDWIALRYLRHPMALPRIALASFLGYAVGNNFGTLLGGSTVRLRLYTAWGLSAVEIVRLVVILSLTFWIGLFAVAGIVFIIAPLPIPTTLHLPIASTVPLGILLACLAVGYLALCAVRHEPIKVFQWHFSPPPIGLSLLQYMVASLDLLVGAAVLYVLLPSQLETTYLHFLSIYLLALVVALFSQVPGGLGVLELVMIVLLPPGEPHRLVGALLAFRVIYYLLPLLCGLILLGGNELALNRRHVGPLIQAAGRWTNYVAPRIFAATLYLAGLMLLLSGATPAAHGRMRLIRDILPLPVVELSHMAASVAGMLLILLAHSVQRRIETAYYAVVLLLSGGIAFSLLKGFDYEEAALLAVMLLAFAPCRRHFYRKGAMLTERFSARWFMAIGMALACTVWLMLFAYKHVDYTHDMWWQFAFTKNAARSLRATAGVVVVALVFSAGRMLRSKPRPPAMPSDADLEDARQIIATSRRTAANLALLGDKHFLFNADRSAFIMYGVAGRSWVSMGDPVSDPAFTRELIWDFRELCDEGGRWPVFYQVDAERVPLYVEAGLNLIKLGEEARVPLQSFGLEGSSRKGLRRTNKQLVEEGCQLEMLEPPLGDDLMTELKCVSDAWLAEKSTAEKGFSLGFFQPDYIRQGPVALVRRQGQVIAFANVWRGADKEELSMDLMRYLPQAPHGVMEFLFIQLMLWGKEQGFGWFNLGMAPLSGVEAQPLGSLWSQLAAIAYRHGEHFYNFQGLRQYKEKFDPDWSAKYLASPGGIALPVILANVATLISGGLVELVKK
ncbi:MAG: bifunctional lysylphosphatidylglycerol flippase/synthetase MprF [Planctomycetales bacterium]|nr:bifunctional lysylphosphatidylglycerol flippase/synthetase MprF [Planctomycetales bacterium]